ncbi:hypothetical protein [Chamaesiphon sp. VAR_69_metabat_338]|uniref:hypothetical protein n=1 Tax=Chamaesiphon sp. VAR_69_metabat_338 TaxID=2964704 RepID=UPI00286E203E|nr:hypothetical protein [Chamaesiphon sp. VAR_69_metabat_338]
MNQNTIFRYWQFAILTILLVSCGVPGASQHQRDVANLPKVFSTLQTLKVKNYRNQDWCKNIAYKRGKFSGNLTATTCNLFDGKPIAMDDLAKQDFQTISDVMATTGVGINYLSASYDPADRLVGATFNLSTICRCSYVYRPRYNRLPKNMQGEMEYTAINPDWYFVWEDWN